MILKLSGKLQKIDLQLFGGRGTDSSSGRYGGGAGLKESDIVDTRELVTTRAEHQAETDELLGTARDFRDKYGDDGITEELQLATLKPSAQTAMAYCDSNGNIAFNETYFDKKKLTTAYDACVKSGFHPGRGNKTAVQAVAAHELGHHINNKLAARLGKDSDALATEICNAARKQTKHRGVVQMENKISRYASSNNKEAIAEAMADVYCNGKKAKRESIAIVNVIDSYYKK